MGQEINLMRSFPRVSRPQRGDEKTEKDRAIARQFGKEFFDGDRRNGYGGYRYNPKYWQPVVLDLQKHYGLSANSRVLDVGCAKGFLLYDFMELIPGIEVRGIDISSYAIENAPEKVKPYLTIGDAKQLPYEDHSFDLVVSLSTLHNFEVEELIGALKEVQRVSKGSSFLFLDGYHSEEEKKQLHQWNLTAKSILHADEWKQVFDQAGFTGDYYWFAP